MTCTTGAFGANTPVPPHPRANPVAPRNQWVDQVLSEVARATGDRVASGGHGGGGFWFGLWGRINRKHGAGQGRCATLEPLSPPCDAHRFVVPGGLRRLRGSQARRDEYTRRVEFEENDP